MSGCVGSLVSVLFCVVWLPGAWITRFISFFAVLCCLANRRLDEWVPGDRVHLQESDEEKAHVIEERLDHSTDGPERKLTRNQKRKHDEINHVQKVRCSASGSSKNKYI